MEYEKENAGVERPNLAVRAYPYVRTLLQLALAGALLTALLLQVDAAAVRREMEGAVLWWLPLAFFFNIASDWFRAIRWRQFFLPLKDIGVRFLFGVAVLGVATNIAVPLRAGEVVRVQVIRKRTGLGVSSIVATLVSEKLMDVVAFSTFIVVGLLLYQEATFLWPLAVAYGAVVLAGLMGARYLARRVSEGSEPEVDEDGGRLRRWLSKELDEFGGALQAFRQPRAMFHIIWSAHAAWLLEALMYYAFGRAMGLDLSFGVYLLVVVAATIAVSVPVTQAGLGVFEVAISGLLVAFGVDAATAAAYSIFAHIFLIIPYLASGPVAAIALRLNITDILFLRVGKDDEPLKAGVRTAAEEAAPGA
jgi:uncharacterized protein (TIRG00374 family)